MNDFGPKDKVNEKAGLFAIAPPLKLVKMLIIKAVRRNWGPAWRHQACSWTSARHNLCAPMPDEEFAELPPEKWKDGQCPMLLIYTVSGMRAATSNWEKEHSGILEEVGFRSRGATVVAFFHAERDIRIILHRDAFVVEENREHFGLVEGVLAARYPLKVKGILASELHEQKSIVILGRIVDRRGDELWW